MLTFMPVAPTPPPLLMQISPLGLTSTSEGVKTAVKRAGFFLGAMAILAGAVWVATWPKK